MSSPRSSRAANEPTSSAGPASPAASTDEPHPRRAVAQLREPEPKVERGQDEEQRERVERDDDEREHAQRQERGRVARELVLLVRRPPGQQALARHEPSSAESAATTPSATIGQSWAGAESGLIGRGVPSGQAPKQPEDGEERAHEEPEREAAAQAPERRRERYPAAPQPREEVDRGREERHEHRDEHELDRPAGDDVAARSRGTAASSRSAAAPRRARRGRPAPRCRPPRAASGWERRTSVSGSGGRSPAVVSVTAGIPPATNGACSYRLNGKPKSTSCQRAGARSGSSPVTSRMRSAAVWTRLDAGERGSSPASTSRGLPWPPMLSRLTTAAMRSRYAGCSANAAAPIPP